MIPSHLLRLFLPIITSILCFSAPIPSKPRDILPGTIVQPTPGTAIPPGSLFNFTYQGRGDYGRSSYFFHVWLVGDDALNKTLTPTDVFTDGWYFGRFDYPNYPAVPYPTNPAPSQLTMPDFAKSEGGWGAGEAVSDLKLQLLVIEEWADGSGSVGRKLGIAANEIVYNATTTSA